MPDLPAALCGPRSRDAARIWQIFAQVRACQSTPKLASQGTWSLESQTSSELERRTPTLRTPTCPAAAARAGDGAKAWKKATKPVQLPTGATQPSLAPQQTPVSLLEPRSSLQADVRANRRVCQATQEPAMPAQRSGPPQARSAGLPSARPFPGPLPISSKWPIRPTQPAKQPAPAGPAQVCHELQTRLKQSPVVTCWSFL